MVGRLLEETHAVPQSRIEKIKHSCAQSGIPYEPAFLLDAFEEEQRQGITIDISQIYFDTPQRRYHVLDSPGHRDFLKNMMSGSTAADTAVLLIDAKEGIREQTRRHSYLLRLLGIESILVAVNKMDLFQYREESFRKIQHEYQQFLREVGVHALHYVPISAKDAVNIGSKSQKMPWYSGPTLLEALDLLPERAGKDGSSLRFSVQDVYKFDDRRIIAGRVESGSLNVGDSLRVWPGGQSIRIASIERWSAAQRTTARSGESIGVTLEEQVFVERGQLIGPQSAPIPVATQFEANVFWLGKDSVFSGTSLKLKLLSQEVDCEIERIQSKVDPVTLQSSNGEGLEIFENDVAQVVIRTAKPIAFDSFKSVRASGRFVLLNGGFITGGGIISRPLRRESDLPAVPDGEGSPVDTGFPPPESYRESRWRSLLKAATWRLSGFVFTVGLVEFFTRNAQIAFAIGFLEALSKILLFFVHERVWNRVSLGRREVKPAVLWFTGLPSSGKSTLSEALSLRLKEQGLRAEILDGDVIRAIFSDQSFSREGRNSHVRKVGYLASRLASNGVFVIVALVSPYRESRDFVRRLFPRFLEIYLSTPLEECEKRDVKGMYARARRGDISNFTGVSDPYEAPENPDLVLDTSLEDVDASVDRIISYLRKYDSSIFRQVI